VIRLAIDAMGGDIGATAVVPACVTMVAKHADVELLLFGDEAVLKTLITTHAGSLSESARLRLQIMHTDEAVAMDDPLTTALRGKRRSSMRLALEAVRDGQAQACVSSGNTGALMALARFVLKTLPGIDRPAIVADMPNQKGATTMLDLGANVDCTAEHLLQFGIMGSAFAHAVRGIETPRVGLLNIGEEVIKGNDVVKQAGQLLSQSSLKFVGNVEGNDIFRGTADVVVCDGFVGNVSLKTSEGLAQMLSGFIREEFTRNWFTKLLALASSSVLSRLRMRVDHRRYNGACLVGLRGIVFKSHGSADVEGFGHALHRAVAAVRNDLLGETTRALERIAAAQAQQSS
jgi:phosphate acyltransferase